MINIINDFNNILHNENGIEIVDDNSFLAARQIISLQKEKRFKDDINIIIKRKKYEKGFEDLKNLEDFVKFKEIDLINILEKDLGISLKGVNTSEVIFTGVNNRLKEFEKFYLPEYKFFQNVIMFNFNLKSMDRLSNIELAIEFIFKNIELIEEMKKEKNSTLEYLKKELSTIAEIEDFLWFINILDYDANMEEYIKVIIFNELFRNYKDFEKEIINKPSIYRIVHIPLSNTIYNELLEKNLIYLEELNLELIKKERQLYLFNSLDYDNFNNFLNRSTGILWHEFNYAFNFIIHEILNMNFVDIGEIEPLIFKLEYKFQGLLNLDEEIEHKVDLAKKLINKIKILGTMDEDKKSFKTIEEWFDFYINKYMLVKNDLDRENNIYEIINEIIEDKNMKVELKNKVDSILDNVNKEYETFIYNNFDTIHTQDKGKYSISSAISKLTRYSNEKIIFLVIDAMRWDIWEIAQSILEDNGYAKKTNDDFLVGMIPTVTSISRLSLFSGNKYKTIMDEKTKGIYEYDYRDEAKHLERFFKGKDVGFVIGGKDKFNQLILEDRDIYSFIYSESDAVLHGLTDINKDVIYYILKEQIDNIVEQIEDKPDESFKIVLTTDHGTIDIKNSTGINLEKTIGNYLKGYSIKLSNHGKYIRIFSEDEIEPEVYNELYEYFTELGYFHIIDKDNMPKYFLPNRERDGYNLFYLICKYNYHIGSTTKSSNTHGGFSMNETLIPFAVFEKEIGDIKELDVEIISNLRYKENSQMLVKIINPNDFDIRNCKLSLEPFVKNYKIDYIKRQNYVEFEINIIPEKYGLIELDIDMEYIRLGEIVRNEKVLEIIIEEDLKTKISKDIKKSRRLDF